MNKCEQLLDDAVAAYDKSVAKERDRRILLVCETFNRIFPDWDDDCVTVDEKGVTLYGDIRLEFRLSFTESTSHFTYSHMTEGYCGYSCERVPVASLTDLGFAIMLHRVGVEMREWRIAEENERTRKRLAARDAALDAYAKKNWLEKLFSKRPGGVE